MNPSPTPASADDADGAVAPDGRRAGRPQATILLIGSTLPILGAILIAPVLPQLQAAFRGTPGVEVLAPVALSIPSLAVGLLAIVAGRIVDRVGRLRLLIGALPLYVVAGTAPLWLDSLPAIVASRAVIGVAEAAIMTCCVTLIGDYWHGERRERYLSLQVVVTSGSAVVFLLAGGALGALGWRTPFWAYLSGLLFLPLALRFLWQPARPRAAAADSGGSFRTVPWRALAPLLVLTLLGAIVFYALQVELSYVLDGLGVGTAGIGITAALANLAVMVAAGVFARLGSARAPEAIAAGFALGGAGLLVMATAGSAVGVGAGAVVAGLGGGLLLASLLVGTTARLPYERRGQGTGAWTSAFFLGQFLCPVLVAGLSAATGALTTALAIVGVAGLLLAGLVAALRRRIVPATVEPAPASVPTA
ncbi:MFS transporter [Actinomycetospora sp. NBRC 106375]|uniref:MFS transporter n=1 Tax=Actinomycetospora sp. NBRC 106375 TaxID=3032207 RepID=UPI0024A03DE6|nr:MFS transporter [Actinomycetospora sp. NBRC 106375]GLZ47084.1 MFS transporter [Actinomycetospora sp. NBRC 106375]